MFKNISSIQHIYIETKSNAVISTFHSADDNRINSFIAKHVRYDTCNSDHKINENTIHNVITSIVRQTRHHDAVITSLVL